MKVTLKPAKALGKLGYMAWCAAASCAAASTILLTLEGKQVGLCEKHWQRHCKEGK